MHTLHLMPAKFKRFKLLAVLACIAISGSVSAQQLYSDSTSKIKEQQSLCMILPDSASIALNVDSVFQSVAIENFSILTTNVFVTSWSQGPTFIYSDIVWSCVPMSCCVYAPSLNLFVDSATIIPPLTEYAIGIAAASPPTPVMFSQGPNSANAAQRFLGMVPNCQIE